MHFLKTAAKALSRTQSDAKLITDVTVVRGKYLLFGAIVVLTMTALVPFYAEQLGRWNDTKPTIVIDPISWKSLYVASPEPCGIAAGSNPRCFANPQDGVLWNSSTSRAAKDHVAQVRARGAEEFWIGTTISADTLKKAAAAEQNHLLLGWLRARFRIWIDGDELLKGTRETSDSIILPFSIQRMNSGAPMHIAIQLFNEAGHPYPDFLNSGVGGEGWLSYAQSVSYRSLRTFINATRPFSLFLANLLVGVIFFLFWTASKRKQEYFYMAVYAANNALIHLRSVDIIYMRMNLDISYALDLALRINEGCLALQLGLAFSRARRSTFLATGGAAFAFLVYCLMSKASTTSRFYYLGTLGMYYIPATYLLGALVCMLQAWYLRTEANVGTYLPIRIRRLQLFAVGLTAIGLLYWSQATSLTSLTHHVYWHKLIHLSLVCFLSVLLFSEYKEQELLVEKTPVSEYHRRPVLPSQLTGAVLVADLKASEALFKLRASQNDTENLVAIWRSHFYAAIHKFGGTVLYKKGDEVIGFFDKDNCPDPMISALQATNELAVVSAFLESDFRQRMLMPRETKGLHFRAALTLGHIRPVWEQMGKSREAYWEEAGNSTPFVEASRLLEMERQVNGSHDGVSLLVLRDDHADQVRASSEETGKRLIQRGLTFKDKHGTEYNVAVYQPEPTAVPGSSPEKQAA